MLLSFSCMAATPSCLPRKRESFDVAAELRAGKDAALALLTILDAFFSEFDLNSRVDA